MSNAKEVYAESAGQKYKLQVLSDFRNFKEFALSKEGWSVHHSNNIISVAIRAPAHDDHSGLSIIRARREMKDVPPEDLYDALHDAQYRKTWDDNMIEGYNIVKLNEHNDIGYYSVKFPWPLKNRDFCNMRSWMEFTNDEFIIFNHSVPHSDCPVKKHFVRAKSIMTGYLIQPLDGGGCVLTYITHSDPCGSIPHAIINLTVTRLVPKVMDTLEKCSKSYVNYYKQHHTVPRDLLEWRTPRMRWDSKFNFPIEELEAAKPVPSVSPAVIDDRAAPVRGLVPTPIATNGLPPPVPTLVSDTRVESLSLAPVAPNRDDDPIPVQQYRALMQDSINTVDKSFLQEGRMPVLPVYLTRLAFIIDGVRQTTPL